MTGDNDDYKRGYREGYQDGMDAARKMYDHFMPVAPLLPPINVTNKCRICGIDFQNAMSYVCYVPNCRFNVSS
jgi:hypothetical protein